MRPCRFLFVLGITLACLAVPARATAADATTRDVDTWLALRRTKNVYPFAHYDAFLSRHADWPDAITIRRAAELSLERSLGRGGDMARVRRYFARFPAVTDDGVLLHMRALLSGGEPGRAGILLNAKWQSGAFDAKAQDFILKNWGRLLTPASDRARVDTLIWGGNFARATRAMTRVDSATANAARIRMRLARSDRSAEQAALNLLARRFDDAGLYYELARFYRGRDRDAMAAKILGQWHGTRIANATKWWRERQLLARRALESGNPRRAYELAAAHGLSVAPELAEAEWLAGWIAATRLKDYARAQQHFERMFHNVKTPISLARAAYWTGVAYAGQNKQTTAREWYQLAARHPHVFYGQMAAYALRNPAKYYNAFFKRNTNPRTANALRADFVIAARYMTRAGKTKERDMFLEAGMAQARNAGRDPSSAMAHAMIIARETNSPKVALIAAKAAYENGTLVLDGLFPRVRVPLPHRVEPALTLAVIRQESQFDRHALSPAGARGLMQLMPGTARQMARSLRMPYRDAAQLHNGDYNMALGQVYLKQMLDRYDQYVPLAVAAYNAGPGNVDRWLREMGDPRKNPATWVDWVERIPFYETRNYVQRVWESYSLYRNLDAAKR
jgi:soluble lytic murein transglycosylase